MTQEVYTLMAACVSGKAKDDYVFTRKDDKQVKDFRGRWDSLLKDAGLLRIFECFFPALLSRFLYSR